MTCTLKCCPGATFTGMGVGRVGGTTATTGCISGCLRGNVTRTRCDSVLHASGSHSVPPFFPGHVSIYRFIMLGRGSTFMCSLCIHVGSRLTLSGLRRVGGISAGGAGSITCVPCRLGRFCSYSSPAVSFSQCLRWLGRVLGGGTVLR